MNGNNLADVLRERKLTEEIPEEAAITTPKLDEVKMEQFSSIEDIVTRYRDMFVGGEMEFTDVVKAMTDEINLLVEERTEEFT